MLLGRLDSGRVMKRNMYEGCKMGTMLTCFATSNTVLTSFIPSKRCDKPILSFGTNKWEANVIVMETIQDTLLIMKNREEQRS